MRYLHSTIKFVIRNSHFDLYYLYSSTNEVNKPNVTEIKKEIKRIAAEFVLNCKDVEKYYYNRATQRIECEWIKSRSKYKKKCLERLLKYNEYLEKPLTDSEMKYIEKELERGIVESIELSLKGGFKPVLYDVNTGVNRGTKRSNEGDAAQFLFVARAVLAGFSCSNVDVRTSPYDAVIDYNTYLLRVQVKGIDHDSIPFVSSPRGGAGADTSAPSNKSKEITRDACDLYVAVEKCDGTCYIIPIGDVEAYLREGKKSLPKTDKDKYKERWDLVEKEARNRFKYDV